ncbi:MAG: HAD-IC family P-type ATPase, partial [Holophaga sp.]
MTIPKAWHSQPLEEVFAQLHTTAAGLSTQEAAERLITQGPNEIQEGRSISPVQIFFRQFKSLIIWILMAAGIISGFLGELVDCFAILAIVVLNAAIGFYQEYKAEKSIAALKQLTAPKATVLRDGQRVSIPATEVVSGDVLALEAGDLVPADARILEAASLRCVESALTGEAKAAAKRATMLDPGPIALGDRTNMVFMGTTVATGTAMAVVVGTAMGTDLGAIAGLMEAVGQEGKTPLQKKLDAFGRVLVWATLGIVLLLFVLGLWRGAKPIELFMTAVSLAVAAVPEGLPAIVTVALALGVMRMARRRSLVRKLPAVETLGSTTVICTDKTGTLTVGKMTARALYVAGQRFEVTGEGYGPTGEILVGGKAPEASRREPLLELASILLGCNQARLTKTGEAWQVMGDPTEGALLLAGLKAGGNLDRLEQTFPKQLEFPFDSDRKRSSMVRRQPNGSSRAYVNGAPGVILALCTRLYTATGIRPLTEEDRHTLLAATQAMAAQALRVLGSAYRDLPGPASELSTQEAVEQDLVFVGLTGMYDPPRAETKGAVATCQAAGIRVVMITGDHPETAAAIGREIGIAEAGELAVTGIELDELSDTQLQERISKISVFAR